MHEGYIEEVLRAVRWFDVVLLPDAAHLVAKASATLCGSAFREHLAFKDCTSLSKDYGMVRRFAEEVDQPFDIRADLAVTTANLPKTRSEEKALAERGAKVVARVRGENHPDNHR